MVSSELHLGVFRDGLLVGCLQYGRPLNGTKTSEKILPGVKMFELNRMVMADSEPRNAESQAIAACHNWLKKNTDIKYLLSFSDGKEGNVGYIYQATNWLYIGYTVSNSFYDIDGDIVHGVTLWHHYKEKHELRDTHSTHKILCLNAEKVSILTTKQHVYLFPLDKRIKFPFPAKPYPKLENEVRVIRRKVLKDENGCYLPYSRTEHYSRERLVPVF